MIAVSHKEHVIMKRIAFALTAAAIAALASGCAVHERVEAVQGPAPSYERPVAVPGAEWYGDRYYSSSYYAPSTAYVRYY